MGRFDVSKTIFLLDVSIKELSFFDFPFVVNTCIFIELGQLVKIQVRIFILQFMEHCCVKIDLDCLKQVETRNHGTWSFKICNLSTPYKDFVWLSVCKKTKLRISLGNVLKVYVRRQVWFLIEESYTLFYKLLLSTHFNFYSLYVYEMI